MKSPHSKNTAVEPSSPTTCICGHKAELDWDGCTDWGGQSWQRVSVYCTECLRDVSIQIDSDRDAERATAHSLISSMWNEFIRANAKDDSARRD